MVAAAAGAREAADAAASARAVWIALGTGKSKHSTLEAVHTEHAAFMAAVYASQVGTKAIGAAIAHVAQRADRESALDVFDSVMDADSMDRQFEALIGLEAAGVDGVAKFIEAIGAFQKAGDAAVNHAHEAAGTLTGTFAACLDSQ